jgi:UDP-N-acetylglucosamine 2-epimerase (non-hydrolysing)|tara:strand:- start:6628 stop:7626 length:999 start_codon:yes stop_codon:yes gene_type:complete
MYLFCYGTRPEMIKMFPLIDIFDKKTIPYKTLFSGQHKDLFEQFKNYLPTPDFIMETMEKEQSLNKLSSKIFAQIDMIDLSGITYVIVQGDTTTAYILAMAAFNKKLKVVHLEAGLRTHNKYSPFPEEMNRKLISGIADIHLCPTEIAVKNLQKEGITKNVYLVGNTIVDAFKLMSNDKKELEQSTLLVTLHRRENRDKMYILWDQLNLIAKTKKIIYIVHPSLNEAHTYLDERIIKLNGVCYEDMVELIKQSEGIITDSGGLQEEAVCAGKKVLICRDTTERPETIESGWGKLVGTKILENIGFLYEKKTKDNILKNPYGTNVCEKIISIL